APAIAAADLPESGIDALLVDRAGRLWIGSQHGLYMRASDRAPLRAVPIGDGGGNSQKALAITALYEDSAGRIWIGGRTLGAYVIEAGGGKARPVLEYDARSGAPKVLSDRVRSFVEVGDDAIWLATEGGGIVEINPRRAGSRRIRHQPDEVDSLYDDDVLALYRERGGVVFVASTLALSQHDPQPDGLLTVRRSGIAPQARLSAPSLLAHPDGSLWLGLGSDGVDIIEPRQGPLGRLRAGAGDPRRALPKGRVLAMANGANGGVYLGTQQGLYLVDAERCHVRRIEFAERSPNTTVWALAWHAGVLWVGGIDGLWALQAQADGTHRLLRHEARSLGDARVTAILAEPDGALWVGTRVGLARLPAGGGPVEQLPVSGVERDQMPSGYVSSLLIDQRGRLWASSYGNGIVVLERTDRAGRRWFRRIGVADGLENNSVNMLLRDGAGAIWASTDDGLARIDGATFKARMLRAADGVDVLAYWTNAGTEGPHGELIFGGSSGITVVEPAKWAPQQVTVPLAVTEIRLNDRALPVDPYNHGSGQRQEQKQEHEQAQAPAPIEVPPAGRERGFSVAFAALDFAAADTSTYSYRLDGFDSDWIGADAVARRVSYTNLPPGDYSLQLRAASRGQSWGEPLTVPVRVLPAWHQKFWVRAAAALAATGLLVLLVQMRTAYLRRRQRELQDMVNERTAELRATQSQLEQLAYADPLTGLPNRRMFNDDLRYMAARAMRDGEPFTLLLIDLDHFKQINDTLGHDAGDALLVEATARLKLAVREADRLSRLGGDEFAVLLAHTSDIEVINVICQRIVVGIDAPMGFNGASMRISASIGAATFGGEPGGVEGLYKAADMALYQAKHAGRGTWRCHTPPTPAYKPRAEPELV
ncbi:MAG: diguanylate cyclase, partial [Massilia sp.]